MDDRKSKDKSNNYQESEEKNRRTSCRFKVGSKCPFCGKGILDYNGMLNVVCPVCGNEISASFT